MLLKVCDSPILIPNNYRKQFLLSENEDIAAENSICLANCWGMKEHSYENKNHAKTPDFKIITYANQFIIITGKVQAQISGKHCTLTALAAKVDRGCSLHGHITGAAGTSQTGPTYTAASHSISLQITHRLSRKGRY